MRWWDGSSWTDRFAGEDGLSPFAPPAPPAGGPGGPRRRSRKWAWPAGVGAAIGGLLVVAGLVGSPDDDPDRTVAATSIPEGPSVSPGSSSPHRSSTTSASAVASTTRMSSRDATIALGRLDDLDVKGRAPKTGYSRDEFGDRWSDDVDVDGGHNGCDTRNDMLGSLDGVTFKPGTRDCVVLTGTLHDPYTGRDIEFARGEKTSTAVQIDHIVALSDAWQKGAQQLTADDRRNLANDPVNLQPTDGPTNSRKSDGDAATWLPPSRSYRCTYVSRQIDVKTKYRLWVTAAEKTAMRRVLGTCGATAPESDTPESDTPESDVPGDRTGTTDRTVVPDRSTATRTPRRVLETPTETVVPETTDEVTEVPETSEDTVDTTEDTGGSVYYANCSQVRAAGAAPIHAGDPGYSRKLDRDGDGVACE
ncbi:hypothetical protein GOAMR_64_00280 [Gordonia amarae NBRC 15530]|uniref:Excalibur calcium-binding domain-containing protein n=2 Tax=Gordonia amarae TaxID=36821 RepID=G7GUS0_9ACTN|nr:hypothetical protein GOAMR_64_00280 [Gordonia amarae NBRC 15530]